MPMPTIESQFAGPKRERGRPQPRVPGTSRAETALEYAIAEVIVRSQGGAFSIDVGEDNEIVLVADIPT